MHLANYTSENICRALGLGGFANDWQLAEAEECIRVLLTPSFHREVCISVLRQGGKVSLSVVVAVSQIWLQEWAVPHLTQVEQEAGTLSETQFTRLLSLLNMAAEPKQASQVVILDGMQAHAVHRADRAAKLNLNQNVGCEESYQSFVAEAIRLSHRALANPRIRNALADSGTYAGLRLPAEDEPPAKEFVRTLVLGGKEETAQLLEALRKQHE